MIEQELYHFQMLSPYCSRKRRIPQTRPTTRVDFDLLLDEPTCHFELVMARCTFQRSDGNVGTEFLQEFQYFNVSVRGRSICLHPQLTLAVADRDRQGK